MPVPEIFKRLSKVVTSISAVALSGCSAAGLLNSITPSSSFDRDKGLFYGSEDRQTYDVYRSSNPKADAPVIVFVYGGGWTDGQKSMYKFLAEGFTKDGYDVVVPDYRLHPQSQYPMMVTDTGLAVRAAGELYPGRPLVLVGHSAGAYNVLMTAMAPEISKIDVCERVAGVISLAGPTGAYPLTEEPYITIFPERFQADDNPIGRVGAPLPPIMLVNGADDSTVGQKNATELGAKLREAGQTVDVKIYEGMNHIDPVRVLSRHFDGGSPLKKDITTFIDGLAQDRPFCLG